MLKKSGTSLSFEQLQELTNCVYDAALDECLWEGVLNSIALTLHADRASMRTLNEKSKNVYHAHTYNVNPDFKQSYIDYHVHNDPWIDFLGKSKKPFFACTHQLLSDKEYKSTEFYQDFVLPQDIHYGIGGKVTMSENSTCYLTFQRALGGHHFEQDHIDTLMMLAPHIQKSVLINKKVQGIELKQNLLSDALNQINSPICLVNKYGTLLFINTLAEQLIKHTDGVSIKNSRIFIHCHTTNKNLLDLIAQATLIKEKDFFTKGGALNYKNSLSQEALSILVSPVNKDITNISSTDDEAALILLGTNNHKSPLTTELLSGLYNLTPAEARLTLYLSHGLTLDEISEKLTKSKNTLRSQLRSSFEKIGISRQSELVRLVNTGPAGLIRNV